MIMMIAPGKKKIASKPAAETQSVASWKVLKIDLSSTWQSSN
jgi:hypothetical protein